MQVSQQAEDDQQVFYQALSRKVLGEALHIYERHMYTSTPLQNPCVGLNKARPYFLADIHVLFESHNSFPGYNTAGWTGNFPLLADLPLPLILRVCW